VAVLALLNAHRFRRLKEEELEEIDATNFEHALTISHEQLATEEAGRLLMAAERQMLVKLNALAPLVTLDAWAER
jgi:hypothetical protein